MTAYAKSNSQVVPDTIQSSIEIARNYVNRKITDSALHYAELAMGEALRASDTPAYIRALGIRGKGRFYDHHDSDAVADYFRALRLVQSPRDDDQAAYLLGEVAYVYFSEGHHKEARDYYYKSLEIRKRLKQYREVANTLINIAVMSTDHKAYKEATIALAEVRNMLPKLRDSTISGYFYTNMGVVQQFAGRMDSAEWYYRRAYDMWKGTGNESQIFRVTFNIGFLAELKGNHAEAIRYYRMALGPALKFGSGRDIAHVYGTMAEAYAGLKNYATAYEYLHQYAEMSDSLGQEEFNAYVAKLDKQFQTEKNLKTIQDQQLKLQTANLAIQKQKNTILTVVLVLIVVLATGIIWVLQITFRGRVKKKVDEARNRFFANVVHEIRTPLAMIQAPLELLQEKVSDEYLVHQLEIARRNTRRLGELVNQMLDLSKLESSAYRLRETAGRLSEFADAIFPRLQAEATQKGILTEFHTELRDATILYDHDALEKIVSNLAGNAIKYTQTGGKVGVSLTEKDNELKIEVWDNGPGISAEEQAMIFDRFYRSGDQEKAGIKGIGLGLALVKELVEIMQGTISVSSASGEGAAFTVTVPTRTLPERQGAVGASALAKTILLVEDDSDILDFNSSLLKGEGYNVLTANDGNAANEIIKDTLPDLVITDLMMPGSDGISLLRAMRANEATDHIPAIVLSARAAADTRVESVTAGAQAYLPKPFLPAELTALVRSQLALSDRQQERYKAQSIRKGLSIEERFAGDTPFTRSCFATIKEHLDDPQLSVERLAEMMHVNRSHFQRKIKAMTGYSPSELIRAIRLEYAREMLERQEGNITEVAYATGFSSSSYFSRCFAEYFSVTPSQLRNTENQDK